MGALLTRELRQGQIHEVHVPMEHIGFEHFPWITWIIF